MEDIAGVWTDLGDAVKEPPRWLIEGVLPSGIVFVAGPPKSRKTTLEMALSLLVAGYENVTVLPEEMRSVVQTGRVLILSAEHTAGELRFMTEDGMGIPIRDDKGIMVADDPWSFRLDDPDALTVLLNWLDVLEPKLFILDPLRDFHSLEEKDDGGMNRMLRPIQKWAKAHDACFMVVHHTAKKKQDDNTHYKATEMRGTGALFGIADGVIMLTPMDGGVIHMDATLKRGAPWQKTVRLGVWTESKQAETALSPLAEQVLNALRDGARNYEVIAKSIRVAKGQVVKAVAELKAANRVTIGDDKRLKVL